MSKIRRPLFFILFLLLWLLPVGIPSDLPVSLDGPLAEAQLNLLQLPFNEFDSGLETCTPCSQEPSFFELPKQIGKAAISEVEKKEQLAKDLRDIFSADTWNAYRSVKSFLTNRTQVQRAKQKVNQKNLDSLYVKPSGDENQKIRALWTQTLGIDIWYPYFKVKEVEKWVKERVSFRFKKIKCSPKFEKNHFMYICKKRF